MNSNLERLCSADNNTSDTEEAPYKSEKLGADTNELRFLLTDFCEQVRSLDRSIRFVGIADYAGALLASFYRPGLVPLMDIKETAQYSLQTVFRARTRTGFEPQLGEQRYAVAAYQNLIRATLSIAHPEAEHHNLYLLVSLDVGSQYPSILEGKIIPYLEKAKSELFPHTRFISEKYVD